MVRREICKTFKSRALATLLGGELTLFRIVAITNGLKHGL